MKNVNVKTILALSVVLGLTACGGGGSDTSTPAPVTPPPTTGNGGNDNTGGGEPTNAPKITGRVIDGYVKGATVFIDINGNTELDEGEPNGVSTDKGEYVLELTDVSKSVLECMTFAPIVVDVPVGAIDEDLGVVEEAYKMYLPPISEEDFSTANVTPLTSALWETFKNDFTASGGNDDPVVACQELLNDQDRISEFKDRIQVSINKVVENYNISEEAIYSDFVASGDVETYDLAQHIVVGLKKALAESNAIKAKNPSSFPLVSYLKNNKDNWVREEYVFTPATNVVDGQWSDNARVSAKTQNVSSDFEQTFETIYTYNRRGAFKVSSEGSVEVAYYNDTCNDADVFEFVSPDNGGSREKVEVVNNENTCDKSKTKTISVYNITDYANDLGTSYKYSFAYDYDASTFPMFGYMEDFHATKESVNAESIVSDAKSYEFDIDIDYDNAQLMETFNFVSTRTRKMENGELIDISRSIVKDFELWRREVTQMDGTYTVQCKDSRDAEWGECE